ncbi:MAG TPA: hypothetical protein VGO62_12435 [Myxococcota bacterium]
MPSGAAAPSAADRNDATPAIARQQAGAGVDGAPRVHEHGALEDDVHGSAPGPAPSIALLESSTGIRVHGAESDAQRAGRLAKARLMNDLSEHDVARGLADDWFRRRRAEVERLWHPQEEQLDDGGKEVSSEALLARTLATPSLWGEADKVIAADGISVAQSFSDDRGAAIRESMMPHIAAPESDAERKRRFIDKRHTHRDAFATSVGLEIVVRHRGDGSVESVDVTEPSGQDRIDDSAVDAVAQALALDASDPAPASVAKGQAFATHWALDVRWEVNVPKCSAMRTGNTATSQMHSSGLPIGCGTTFGNDGVDVPFTVKKSTHVELVSIEKL